MGGVGPAIRGADGTQSGFSQICDWRETLIQLAAISTKGRLDKRRSKDMAAQAVWAIEPEAVNHSVSLPDSSTEIPFDDSGLSDDDFCGIVGNSTTLRRVLRMVKIVAPTDATVLINGETGTGKELIAQAVHKCSDRSSGPFIKVNCAAIPATLLESELFGHERGAFTGALTRRMGRFELANRGTLFLDEIGEIPLELQSKLLRVLQEREFERVGGTQSVQVNVRVIAATNRDLKACAAAGNFRSDLFYRLNVFPIQVPALRERRHDIRILLEHFITRYARRMKKSIRSINNVTLDLFQTYDWPGNIRELQNLVERAVILSSGDVFSAEESWFTDEPPRSSPESHSRFVEHSKSEERRVIEGALAETRGRIAGPAGAAARLRIPRSTLESKIKALDISKGQFKFAAAGL
jgi:formate hydrogenlyase transcriptional activator